MINRKFRVLALAAALTVAVGAWAQQSTIGGSASRPRLQHVTVIGQAASTNGEKLTLRSRDTVGDNWVQFRKSDNTAQGYVGFGDAATDTMSLTNEAGGAIQFNGPGSIRIGGTSDTATTNISYVSFRNLSGTEIGWVGEASSGSSDITLTNNQSGANLNLVTTGGGAVQINGAPISWGTYTPTGTATTNLDSVTPAAAQWMRVGSVITVSGSVTVDPTTASVATQFRLSLPVASAFTLNQHLGGAGVQNYSSFGAVMIRADITNDQADFNFSAGGTAAATLPYSYTYQVL